MSDAPTRSRQLIAEEAAEWFVELREKPPGRDVKDRFVSWLTESPVHVEEYLAMAQVFGVLRQVDTEGQIDAATLADQTVVVLHGEPGQDLGLQSSVRAKPARFGSWMAAAALVIGVGASALYLLAPRPEVYETRLGEQRSVVLEDGSMVSLNTSTRIEVAFNEETRQVHLTQGEALFEVEKDASRPFQVETRAAVIRVTGTQFNVYDEASGTAVTVLEGTVEVVPREPDRRTTTATQRPERSSGPPSRVASLGAGHQALVRGGSAEIQTTTLANLEPVTAWTERRLVFDATPLSEIVREFNRYNRERLVIDDPELASLELSGVFGSNDPQSLVLFLKRVADVEVVTATGGTEIRIHSGSR